MTVTQPKPGTPPVSAPFTAASDADALARLRALPTPERDRLLDTLAALPTAAARQDRLIADRRLAPSLPALEAWLEETRTDREERRFAWFLADVRRAAERAEEFRDVLARAEGLHRVNVALLAARLFDALVARDQAAIEKFAHTFAEVVGQSVLLPRQPTFAFAS